MSFSKDWAEILFIFFIIVGLIISIFIRTFAVDALILFVAGILFARLVVPHKRKWSFPYVILALGFLMGYLIATHYTYWFWLIIFFIIGVVFARIFDVFREHKK